MKKALIRKAITFLILVLFLVVFHPSQPSVPAQPADAPVWFAILALVALIVFAVVSFGGLLLTAQRRKHQKRG
jgi:NADH:ubiquinone oxidoreductase subunit 3 (subunit A)